jgi:hypothetical protein
MSDGLYTVQAIAYYNAFCCKKRTIYKCMNLKFFMYSAVEDDEVKQPETRQTRKRGRRANTDWTAPAVNQVSKRTRTNSQDTNSGAGTGANLQVARTSNGSPPAEPPDPALEADPNLSLKVR